MDVSFYHLQSSSLEKALPRLLEKVLDAGLRAVVVTDPAFLPTLNDSMWTFRPDGFVPHATRGDGDPIDNPVWLTDKIENPNQSEVLVTTCGKEPEITDQFSKYIYFFNGLDNTELDQARALWKSLKGQGINARYFQQTPKGAWEEKQLNS